MLRAEDNKFLTESGSGTGSVPPRRFWMPVLLSAELLRPMDAEEDCRHGRGTAGLPR